MDLFHSGNRDLQDQFGSRRIADRLQGFARTAFSDEDRAFIAGLPYFFLASANAAGRPDCSFKGGPPGFVQITGPSELAFPDFDGNGMFKSLGNLQINPGIGLLFIALHGSPRRLRVNGTATVHRDDALLATTVGAQMIVRVAVEAIFPNCPRYLPTMEMVGPSAYSPVAGRPLLEPAWKGFPDFADVVPPRAPTFSG
jgi:predicted pyridoxine 5'-phosphate oxidase superfamily flavin-nucleotide-binding protein